MTDIIHLKDEEIRIIVKPTEEIDNEYNISVKGAIIKCIKGIYRYGEFTMPKEIMVNILWLAHKGHDCKEDHLDISQRLSLYEYLKGKDINDPYIEEFIKQTKENFKTAIL
jgi:hypothetical protein